MLSLSKRYSRVLIYISSILLLFLIIHRYQQHISLFGTTLRPFSPLLGTHSLSTEAKIILDSNGLSDIDPSSQVVVNIGHLDCFHVTKRHLQHCTISNQLSQSSHDGKDLQISRHIIKKDLRGSFGYRWFSKSQYLFYETVPITLLLIGNDNNGKDESNNILQGIVSISKTKTSKSTTVGDLEIATLPFTVDNLRQQNQYYPGFISDLNILFGIDCVEPRFGWILNKDWTLIDEAYSRFPSYLSTRYLINKEEKVSLSQPLRPNKETGKFKIVQLADLHMAVGENTCRDEFPKTDEDCKADPKTLKFIESVLDIESPQLVIYTGDQIMGDLSIQDSETTLLKALSPVISRRLSWAMVWGNHDDEGSLSRWQLSELASILPFSLFQFSPKDTNDNSFGVGNYVENIYDYSNELKITLYFLDSHKYSKNGKIFPGYDWIKEDQWEYMKSLHSSTPENKGISMAFFHIPLPEYLDLDSKKVPSQQNEIVGQFKEGVTAPKYNSGGLSTLQELGVTVTSCGHDHCNDYCLRDDSTPSMIWLCYGGSAGEGAYAGYGGTERRIRVFEIDTTDNSVYTWKRLNGSPSEIFDKVKLQ
ncbi:phosphoprotein phosphatase NDAI_0J01970 [Naumovozyma dairenensis CBS 421]|uniref:Calcineurin-like phosphoesterase domain-containing protein n=1 Tax=Naumovozyma dairenensis (strain ATCC 10597 / BCRC 20456 / CBS 421 / NBRC 0211 / NRRL Y-12639) TaxID=1071378 RepID=G0WH11_NAUDC|nr:hypothetical protein NDAI_0J01970 [Naumovozyma dairenensis CBS 421]CCD27089.1 hypothetical protein NDAI_0J01970 [Naumovozyma dairenensis CBS 421]